MVSRAGFSRIHPFLPIPLPKSVLEFMFSYLDDLEILAPLNPLPFELLATSGTSKFPNQVNLTPRLPRSNPSLHRANRLPSHNNIPHRLRTNLHPYRSIASGLHSKSPILHQRTRLPPFHPHRYRAKLWHHSPLLRPQPPKTHELPSWSYKTGTQDPRLGYGAQYLVDDSEGQGRGNVNQGIRWITLFVGGDQFDHWFDEFSGREWLHCI